MSSAPWLSLLFSALTSVLSLAVCGEVFTYNDLKEYGSENAVKAAGKLMQKGKPYEMVDGCALLPPFAESSRARLIVSSCSHRDIVYWKHNA